MTFTNTLMLALMAFSCGTTAQAREASLLRFDQSAVPVGSPVAPEYQVGTALRFHLESIARTERPTEVTLRSQMPQPSRLLRQPIARWSQNASASPALFSHLACTSGGYASAWWLQPEVEIRRSVHYASMASIACEFGVPISLLDAVIAQESGYNPWAVSRAGAMGMMQIMPGTARSLGLNTPFDPISSMRAGARYLRQQIERFGRIDLALAAYNAGPERRSLAVGYVPAIPETVNYVQTISRNWARLAAAAPTNDLRAERAIAASNAVLAAGYRGVELSRYDGMNVENPI